MLLHVFVSLQTALLSARTVPKDALSAIDPSVFEVKAVEEPTAENIENADEPIAENTVVEKSDVKSEEKTQKADRTAQIKDKGGVIHDYNCSCVMRCYSGFKHYTAHRAQRPIQPHNV